MYVAEAAVAPVAAAVVGWSNRVGRRKCVVLLPYCLVQHVCQAFFNPGAVDACARPGNKGKEYASSLDVFFNRTDIPALP